MMKQLESVETIGEIKPEYKNSPISLLFEYHNLGRSFDTYTKAQLLVGMCMDNRKRLRMPDNFAYVIRTGGANLRYSEFYVSYAMAVGAVKAIVLIGHNQCGMVNLNSKREQFVQGLVENAGWEKERGEEHFRHFAPKFEIGNEIDFVTSEAKRLRLRFPKIQISPLMYLVEDNLLYFVREN